MENYPNPGPFPGVFDLADSSQPTPSFAWPNRPVLLIVIDGTMANVLSNISQYITLSKATPVTWLDNCDGLVMLAWIVLGKPGSGIINTKRLHKKL